MVAPAKFEASFPATGGRWESHARSRRMSDFWASHRHGAATSRSISGKQGCQSLNHCLACQHGQRSLIAWLDVYMRLAFGSHTSYEGKPCPRICILGAGAWEPQLAMLS